MVLFINHFDSCLGVIFHISTVILVFSLKITQVLWWQKLVFCFSFAMNFSYNKFLWLLLCLWNFKIWNLFQQICQLKGKIYYYTSFILRKMTILLKSFAKLLSLHIFIKMNSVKLFHIFHYFSFTEVVLFVTCILQMFCIRQNLKIDWWENCHFRPSE